MFTVWGTHMVTKSRKTNPRLQGKNVTAVKADVNMTCWFEISDLLKSGKFECEGVKWMSGSRRMGLGVTFPVSLAGVCLSLSLQSPFFHWSKNPLTPTDIWLLSAIGMDTTGIDMGGEVMETWHLGERGNFKFFFILAVQTLTLYFFYVTLWHTINFWRWHINMNVCPLLIVLKSLGTTCNGDFFP